MRRKTVPPATQQVGNTPIAENRARGVAEAVLRVIQVCRTGRKLCHQAFHLEATDGKMIRDNDDESAAKRRSEVILARADDGDQLRKD